MTALDLGTLTDIGVARLRGAVVTEHADHVSIATPDNPHFFWGNYLTVLDHTSANEVERWLAVFRLTFPEAVHTTIVLPVRPDVDAWALAGLAYEPSDNLISHAAPRRTPTPPGYRVRRFTNADWDGYLAAEQADNERTGRFEADFHTDYLRRSIAARRRLVAGGSTEFFAAVTDAGELAAFLGIAVLPETLGRTGLARYQHVFTADHHRRRGLAGHLVGEAGTWAGERGASTWIICTEADNPAGRVYRAAGFSLGDVGHAVHCDPGNGR